MIKISAFSDGHGKLPNFVDYHDVCVLVGDLCPNWSRNWIGDGGKQIAWFKDNYIPLLNNLLKKQTRQILLLGGNHDGMFDPVWLPQTLDLLKNEFYNDIQGWQSVQVLHDQEINILGYKFYGTPWTFDPGFNDTGWGLGKRTEQELGEIFDKIPPDVDVLLTHTPPYGILDAGGYSIPENYGSVALRRMYTDRKFSPKLHLFGHCHWYNGATLQMAKTKFCNTSETETYHIIK